MKKELSINNAQLPVYLYDPKYLIFVGGRNTGKSNMLGKGIDAMKLMPGSVSSLTSATYKQIVSNILPSTLSYLERLGYTKDVHYFFKTAPPKEYQKQLPYEIPLNFENYITFLHEERCWGVSLVSMDRERHGRGKNIDHEFSDEFLTFDFEAYNRAVHASNRGNDNRGWNPKKHHGAWHFSSMPYDAKGKKMLEIGKYYENEFGFDYLGTWRKVVNMQMQLFEIDNPKDFVFHYNEMIKLRRTMVPQVSKNGTLFILTNALDNAQGGGFRWMREQYETTPTPLIFQIEVMNQIVDTVEDNYYFLDERHEYKNAVNYDFIDSLGNNFNQIQQDDCRQDADHLTNLPLILSFDWGGNFSGLNVEQEIKRKNADLLPPGNFIKELFYNNLQRIGTRDLTMITFINEFYIKPPGQLVKHLATMFLEHYKYHNNKHTVIINDTFGDHKRNTERTMNEEFRDILRARGWKITVKKHYGHEPPHDAVWKMVNNCLREVNPAKYPIFRFNSVRCKNTIISMKNTRVKETDRGGLKKDKSSERLNSGVRPEHATHFGDSIGKFTYTYVPGILKGKNAKTNFIDGRF